MESGLFQIVNNFAIGVFTFFYYDVKLTKAKSFLISSQSIMKHCSTATFIATLMVLFHCLHYYSFSGLHKTLLLELHLVNNFTVFQKEKTQTVSYSSYQVGT